MNRAPILFRCDALSSQGYESFYQCLAYAAALQRRRRGTHFLSQMQPSTLASAIQRGGNEWRIAQFPLGSEEDIQETVAALRQMQAAAIIVGDPNVRGEYLERLAETGVFPVTFDSQAAVHLRRGLLINPMLGPSAESYLVGAGTQMLLGARYALVRPFIRRMRPMRAQEPPPPFRGIVAFGDDDFRGQTLIRVRDLLGIAKVEKIDVIIRPQHPAMLDLLGLVEENSDRLAVATEPSDIALRIGRCHFALSSGDGWSLELACVGVPQLMLVQSPWHMLNAQRLDDEGAATNLGDCESVTPVQLRQAVMNVLTDPRERMGMARCGRKLIDGRGPDRLVNALEIMLHSPAIAEPERLAA
jgi:spore coat polysaccharide biosynthesis predicted glycosyltransferase SpsG